MNNEWFGNRKSLPEVLAAFTEFARTHDDACLYLHCDLRGDYLGGIDLAAVGHELGTPTERVFVTVPEDYRAGLTRERMAEIYQTFDVLMTPSAGEGFGVPVIEAQACGVPVIVSNWCSQPELVGAGWGVGGQRRWAPWVNAWQFTPSIPDLVESLNSAYNAPRPPLAAARKFTRTYDHDELFRTRWMPWLEQWAGPPQA